MAQLLARRDPALESLGWYKFTIRGRNHASEAGAWCLKNIKENWTFYVETPDTLFWVESKPDAMLFKLTWCLHFPKKEEVAPF